MSPPSPSQIDHSHIHYQQARNSLNARNKAYSAESFVFITMIQFTGMRLNDSELNVDQVIQNSRELSKYIIFKDTNEY